MSDLSKRIANLSPEKVALLRKALKASSGSPSTRATEKIPARSTSEPAPLSFGQERLWFIDQLQVNSSAYNVPAVIPLHGPVDAALLDRCLAELVRRHEILRTTFPVRSGRPVQLVLPFDAAQIRVRAVDLGHLHGGDHDAEMQRQIATEIRQPFDLAKGPLLRTALLKLAPREGQPSHFFIVVMHHIISDEWSGGVFLREITMLYQSFGAGQPSPLPDLPIQYADFALWQRDLLKGPYLEKLLSHWKEKLHGAPAVLELPTDRPRPSVPSYRGAVHTFSLPTDLHAALRRLSERAQATMFMTTLAVFQLLLGCYTAVEDVVVGIPIANRSRGELEGLIGFFLNTLVIRTRLSGNPTFLELLERVRRNTLDTYSHQDLPFEMLVEMLRPDRSMSVNPIFQVMFVMQSRNPSRNAARREHVDIDIGAALSGTSRFDLSLSLVEGDGHLSGMVEYSSELFDAHTIERMAGHYRALLEAVARTPEAPISQFSMLSAAEREEIHRWWDTTANYHPAECFHHLLEQQADEHPDAVAVAFGGQQATYRELNSRANQLAHRLRALGVGPEACVGIFCERSLEMLVAVFGVLKAGGAYVPLDPTYPTERLQFMLADTRTPILLTQEYLGGRLPAYEGRLLYLDRDWKSISHEPRDNPESGVQADHPAYVIYTSGSTGRPKGLVVPHRGVCNLAEVEVRLYRTGPRDRILQFASLNFDASVYEMLMWLRGGGILQLVSADVIRSGSELVQLLEREKITILAMPPSVLAALPVAELPALRLILVMGEECPQELVARWRLVPEFFNAYGPTETSVWTAGAFLRPDQPIVIGRPVANTRLYLLDAQRRPVPVGVPGEIYIGGVGVTRGYLRRPEITAEYFLPDPFSDEPGKRMYRTGDLAVYQPDGAIRFLGRRDFQVKIRGFRIELGEVESALGRVPNIKDVLVMVRDDLPGGRGLVAYLRTEESRPSTSELRRFLLERLPNYMVPAAFVVLDAFPLTLAGKVDRQALPAPRDERPALDASFIPSTNPVEQAIAGIWASLLGLERVGIDDNFFELGGHSLLAAQIVSRVREAFQVDVSIRHVFEFPTIGGLVSVVEQELKKIGCRPTPRTPVPSGGDGLARQPRDGEDANDALLNARIDDILAVLTEEEKRALAERLSAPRAAARQHRLSFAQERLWFLRQMHPDDVSYNIPIMLPFEHVAPTQLRGCLLEIVRRHEILRTTFHVVADRPVQLVAATLDLELPVIDLRDLDEAGRNAAIERIVTREATHRFNLAIEPLLRATLIHVTDVQSWLLLLIDHIIADEWSISVLASELHALYQGASLPALPLQYGDHARRQRELLQGEVVRSHVDYWREKLRGVPTLIELPLDRPRSSERRNSAAALHSFAIPAHVAERLKALGQREQTTLFTVVLAGFQAFLWRCTRQRTIVVGSPVTNRNHPDIECLIGLFVNILVLRADLTDELTFGALVQQVRATVLEAFVHQDLPFEKLVEELQPKRDLSVNPLFQVAIILHSASHGAGDIASQPRLTAATAKFDLSLHLQEAGRRIDAVFEYNLALFDSPTITRMADRLVHFIARVTENPDRPIVDLSQTDVEREVERNDADAPTTPAA